MTVLEFATNQRATAAEYLDHEQMDYLTVETKDYILDGVSEGICRVRDPLMYGGSSGIVPESGDRSVWEPWVARLKELHDRDYKLRPQAFTLTPGDLPDGYEVEWGYEIGDDRKHIFWRGTTHSTFGARHCAEDCIADGNRLFRRIIGPSIEVDPRTMEDKETA